MTCMPSTPSPSTLTITRSRPRGRTARSQAGITKASSESTTFTGRSPTRASSLRPSPQRRSTQAATSSRSRRATTGAKALRALTKQWAHRFSCIRASAQRSIHRRPSSTKVAAAGGRDKALDPMASVLIPAWSRRGAARKLCQSQDRGARGLQILGRSRAARGPDQGRPPRPVVGRGSRAAESETPWARESNSSCESCDVADKTTSCSNRREPVDLTHGLRERTLAAR
eukprot:Amastigsp_a762_29.p3 type:complete len:228 gc:universal Amastigsp_a762_29:814-131(-)